MRPPGHITLLVHVLYIMVVPLLGNGFTLTSYSEATCNISFDCIPTIDPTAALDKV